MKFLQKIKNKFKNLFNKDNKKYKTGIAFGGGGARGFVHLGALKAFEEEGIDFDYVAGTSAGSIIGALYAKGLKLDTIMKLAKDLTVKDIKTSRIPLVPNKTDKLEEVLKNAIGDAVFSDLKKPLSVVAVDIKSAKELDITSGSVIKAVAGSCAFPLFFNPVEFDDYMLMDGGLTNTIPANVLKNKGCKYIISVDVNPGRGYGTDTFKLIDILGVSLRIMMSQNAKKAKLYSDVVIEPDTKRFKSTKIIDMLDMIEEGYQATMQKMPEIKKLLKIKTPKAKKQIKQKKLKQQTEEDKENIVKE